MCVTCKVHPQFKAALGRITKAVAVLWIELGLIYKAGVGPTFAMNSLCGLEELFFNFSSLNCKNLNTDQLYWVDTGMDTFVKHFGNDLIAIRWVRFQFYR